MKNIIFDWSGVIKDAFKSHLWVVNRIFKSHGLKEFTLEELKNEWEEPFMIFFNKYLPDLTLDEERIEYREGVLNKDYPKSKPYPGIIELIRKFKENGYFIAVITSDLEDSVFPEIKEYGLENFFSDIVFKVHDKTEAVKGLITKNFLKLDETIIVGDSNNEITAAHNLGIKSIAVTWGFAKEEKLIIAKPDFVAHDLKELEGIVMPNLESHGVVVIIKKENKFLLLKDSRDLMLGSWGPPHGRCEPSDKTEEDAVVREVLEETNLQVKPLKKLWTTEADTKVKTVSFWEAELMGGELKVDPGESSEYGWFNVDEALELQLYPGTKKFLELVKDDYGIVWS